MTYDRCKCILSHIMKSFSRAEKKAPWSYILFIHVIFGFSNRKEKKINIQTITSSMGEHTNGFALQLFRYSILKPIIWHF